MYCDRKGFVNEFLGPDPERETARNCISFGVEGIKRFPLLPPSFEGLGSWLEHAMVHTMVHGKYRGIGFPCSIVRVPIETESVSAPQILDRPRYLCTMVSIVYKCDT